MITTIPGVWFAGLMGKKARDYFEVEESKRKIVKVKFLAYMSENIMSHNIYLKRRRFAEEKA